MIIDCQVICLEISIYNILFFYFIIIFYSGLICEFDLIIPSIKTEGYRNKCDFTIGYNKKGEISVGFRYSGFTKGSIKVGEIEYIYIYLYMYLYVY